MTTSQQNSYSSPHFIVVFYRLGYVYGVK